MMKRKAEGFVMKPALIHMFFFLFGYALCFLWFSWITQTNTKTGSQPETETSYRDFFNFSTECSPEIWHQEVLPTIFAKVYNNTTPYDEFPPGNVRPLLTHDDVNGWGTFHPVFRSLIEFTRPKVIIEVGTLLGKSAIHMAKVTRSLGLSDTPIICIDTFRGWPGMADLEGGMFKNVVDVNGDLTLMHQFMQNAVDAGEEDRVIPMPYPTWSALDSLCQWGVYGDLVEVDASSTFHSAWDDINRAWKVVKPGGTMFGHDFFNGEDNFGVRRAVELFAKVERLQLEIKGEYWVLSPKED